MVEAIVRTGRRIAKVCNPLCSIWERVQVSRHGAYTTRRARALERYVHSKSFTRVLAVCLLTPLPVLSFVLLQELVPLEPPAAGWRANYRWFVRSAVIFMVLTLGYIQQGIVFLAPLKVSWRQALVVTFSTTAAYFGVLTVISTAWVFPIPFACVVTTGSFTCLFFGVFVAVIGWQTLATTPRLSAHSRILKGVLVAEAIIVFVYPASNAAFRSLRGAQQLVFMLFLFLLKVIMRLVMAYALRRGEGGMAIAERWRARLPEVVVFSAELFHVLYLTACLQGDHVTIWATIGLSLFDASGSMVSICHLLRRPSVMLIPDRSNEKIGPSRHSLRAIVPVSDSTLPSSVRLPIIDSTTSNRFSSRRRSSAATLSTSRRLSIVLAAGVGNLKLARRSSSRSRSSMHSNESVPRSVPRISFSGRPNFQPLPQVNSQEFSAQVLRLQTLSKTEYFLLVEYVKCIIPAMYGIFQVVVARLPNAVYYPSLANATPLDLHRAQTNILVFVSLEICSLAAFMVVLHRRLHFSVLHQLAFVLETAADDIQAKLAMFIPYCFFFFLEHNGVDYSFQFSWVDKS